MLREFDLYLVLRALVTGRVSRGIFRDRAPIRRGNLDGVAERGGDAWDAAEGRRGGAERRTGRW